MKAHRFLTLALAAVVLAVSVTEVLALPRHAPRNPRGVMDPRGIADPRGVLDPRGIADPRGPLDPRNPYRYTYALPAGYAIRNYRGVNYYYSGGIYYYPHYVNGQTAYIPAPMVNGNPTVPAFP